MCTWMCEYAHGDLQWIGFLSGWYGKFSFSIYSHLEANVPMIPWSHYTHFKPDQQLQRMSERMNEFLSASQKCECSLFHMFYLWHCFMKKSVVNTQQISVEDYIQLQYPLRSIFCFFLLLSLTLAQFVSHSISTICYRLCFSLSTNNVITATSLLRGVSY